ncbi:alginate export family protein [Parahaliea mediterranea]|uniref:Alginate export family protein n=1 Tax=Parahaliea mediterranea TaxID=651086 RepID=A0A939DEM9_9GAMM|nr:alginate export family protein [Parahaliea mediterranea]MBN7796738.1 alginate export family protein [Parahaliea mediterranea]
MRVIWGVAGLGVSAVGAEELAVADSMPGMVAAGNMGLDLRYRYEHVDTDALDRSADASTLRTRVTFSSASYRGFAFMAEVDNVTGIGAARFNDTGNGETGYPVVADPEGTEINQAWLSYSGDALVGTYGRQRILHGNQRFVGGVAWRQNEQTFDGFRARWEGGVAEADYAYVYNVNRIFGPDDTAQPANWHGENHLLRIQVPLADGHALSGFAYLLDVAPQAAFTANQAENNGSDTWGLEYAGKIGPVAARLSYARQTDGGDSQLDYGADYYLLEGAAPLGPVTATLGYEVLDAGDGVGFKTPLATLHKFQGWADMFLATPGDGVEDLYAGLAGAIGSLKVAATWHDFQAAVGGADFGSELNLAATWPLHPRLSLQLKYANFASDNRDRYADTQKAWLTVTFSY